MFNIFGKASNIRSLSQENAKKKLNEDKEIILLDVRTPQEYKEKHIPNSLLFPLDTIKRDSEKKLTNKEATIFVYCRSGVRSATAVTTLVNLGYTNVYNIGGIMTWPYETEK